MGSCFDATTDFFLVPVVFFFAVVAFFLSGATARARFPQMVILSWLRLRLRAHPPRSELAL